MNFTGKTVLVSGANGFLPGALVDKFLDLGANVIALCRNEKRAKDRFSSALDHPRLRLLIQDVCDPVRLEAPLDFAIHGASPAGIRTRHEFPLDTFNANLLGGKNLLDLRPKRFMLISSVDVYGDVYGNRRLTETDVGYLDTLNQRNAYSLGKRAAETLSILYSAQYGVETVIARPFQVYGPGMAIGDGRLQGDFIHQIVNSGRITLKSDGSARRSFMYIDDAVDGLLTVLGNGKNENAYNVVDENGEATVLELAEMYANALNASIEFDYDQRGSIEVTGALPCVLGSSEKLRDLGWKPVTSLTKGVEKTIEYYFKK